MTRKLFAMIAVRGPRWNDAEPMEGQEDWRLHAEFMNALVDEGVVLLGGPLAGTREVLLIVRADSEQDAEARLAPDIWRRNDLLRTRQIAPWGLRLGALGDP
jgi:uncharacterized protein YciI